MDHLVSMVTACTRCLCTGWVIIGLKVAMSGLERVMPK